MSLPNASKTMGFGKGFVTAQYYSLDFQNDTLQEECIRISKVIFSAHYIDTAAFQRASVIQIALLRFW